MNASEIFLIGAIGAVMGAFIVTAASIIFLYYFGDS